MIPQPYSVSEIARFEGLFDKVESELVHRYAIKDIPELLHEHSTEADARLLVYLWWEIYHESACAIQQRNRTVWNRQHSTLPPTLDTATLAIALVDIQMEMRPDLLNELRPSHQGEFIAVNLINELVHYYYKQLISESDQVSNRTHS